MARPEKFYLVLVGNGDKNEFSPLNMRGKELGEFLALLDEMFSSVVNTQIGDDLGGLRIAGVSKGSLCVACQPTKAQAPAFADLANQIGSGCFAKKIRPTVDKIQRFNAVQNTRLEFRREKKGQPVATIHPQQPHPESCAMPQISIKTSTTLYGKITGINGVSKIRVMLSLLGFPGTIRFEVRKKDDIKKFCTRFGQVVGVSGVAEVSLPDREVMKFAFKDFSPYQERPLTESVEELRNAIGEHFNVADIDAVIREHRG